MDFLGGHRLGLDDGVRFNFAQDADDDIARLPVGARPMDLGSALGDSVGKRGEMLVEMIDGLPFRLGGGLARNLPVLERRLAQVAGGFIIAQGGADDLAMAQVGRDAPRVLLEFFGVTGHG
jgi:hypothetical protein